MLGLIVSEYVPNTLFQQLFDREIGSVSVVYSLRHIPRIFQPLAKLLCSDCKLLIRGNLTKSVFKKRIDFFMIVLEYQLPQ